MTPNAIEILIHCHVCPLPHRRRDVPAVGEELASLEINGMIEPGPEYPGGYRTTPRGKAHIEQLCGLAWPVQVWIGADGKVIDA